MIELINYSFWGQDNLGTGLLIQNLNLVANAPWDTFPGLRLLMPLSRPTGTYYYILLW